MTLEPRECGKSLAEHFRINVHDWQPIWTVYHLLPLHLTANFARLVVNLGYISSFHVFFRGDFLFLVVCLDYLPVFYHTFRGAVLVFDGRFGSRSIFLVYFLEKSFYF